MTEYQERIVACLEEANADNVFSVLNTIDAPRNDFEQVREFQSAIEGLVSEGCALLGMEGFVPRNAEKLDAAASIILARSLGEWFRFNQQTMYWTLAEGDIRLARIPYIALTDSGRSKSWAVLDARGYQWWRQPKN